MSAASVDDPRRVLSGANASRVRPSLAAAARSANDPLTSRPVALGSDRPRLSAASPAVEMTLAVVVGDVVASRRPGVNAPNDAGVPSASDSVAGTVPPTVPSGARALQERHVARRHVVDLVAVLVAQVAGVAAAGRHERLRRAGGRDVDGRLGVGRDRHVEARDAGRVTAPLAAGRALRRGVVALGVREVADRGRLDDQVAVGDRARRLLDAGQARCGTTPRSAAGSCGSASRRASSARASVVRPSGMRGRRPQMKP